MVLEPLNKISSLTRYLDPTSDYEFSSVLDILTEVDIDSGQANKRYTSRRVGLSNTMACRTRKLLMPVTVGIIASFVNADLNFPEALHTLKSLTKTNCYCNALRTINDAKHTALATRKKRYK